MNRQEVFSVLEERFLIEMVEILDFNVQKNSAIMNVLCVEGKGAIDKKYDVEFSDVLLFEYCTEPWVLTDGALEMLTDSKMIINLKNFKEYPLEKPNSDEYWVLLIECPGFKLNIAFKSVLKKSIN